MDFMLFAAIASILWHFHFINCMFNFNGQESGPWRLVSHQTIPYCPKLRASFCNTCNRQLFGTYLQTNFPRFKNGFQFESFPVAQCHFRSFPATRGVGKFRSCTLERGDNTVASQSIVCTSRGCVLLQRT